MARRRLRPAQCRPLHLSSIVVLMECCCVALCQLERTSDSTCGSIVCPEEIVQYECRVPNNGSGIVWKLPGCLEKDLEILHGATNTGNGTCVDGTAVVMARGSVNESSFVSQLNVNIIRRLEQTLTVRCFFDDGSDENLIGTDELTSITAPVPSVSRQQSATVSEIIINLHRELQLEGCSNLQYNFSGYSRACGICIPVSNNNITCTNSEVSGCTFTVQTIVCGVVVNESTFPIDTSQITTSTSISTDNAESDSDNLTGGIIAAIVIAVVVVVVVVIAVLIGAVSAVIYMYCHYYRGKSQRSDTNEEDPLNQTGNSLELPGIYTSNGTHQGNGDTGHPDGTHDAGDTAGADHTDGASGAGDTVPFPAQDSSTSASEQVMAQGGNTLQASDGQRTPSQPTTDAVSETVQNSSSPSLLVGSETGGSGMNPVTRSAEPTAFVSSSGECLTPIQRETARPSDGAVGGSPTETVEINTLRKTMEVGFKNITSLIKASNKQVQDEIETRESQVSSLSNKISSLSNQISSLEKEVTKLKSQLADCEQKLQEKEDQLQQELNEKEKHMKEIQDLKQTVAETTSKLEQKDQIISDLRAEVEKLRSEKALFMQQQQSGDN